MALTTPIYSLPVEMLRGIFLIAYEEDSDIVMSLIRVSRYFRHVAEGYPRLWTRLNLRFNFEPYVVNSAGLYPIKSFSPPLKDQSFNSLDHVVVNALKFVKAAQFMPHSLQSLVIVLPYTHIECLLDDDLLSLNLPWSIKELELTVAEGSADFESADALDFELPDLPLLRVLKLTHIRPHWRRTLRHNIHFTRLQILHLENHSFIQTVDRKVLLEVLSRTPALLELTILNAGTCWLELEGSVSTLPIIMGHGWSPLPTVDLPELQRLNLVGYIYDIADMIAHLRLPNCNQLFCNYGSWYDLMINWANIDNFHAMPTATDRLALLGRIQRVVFIRDRFRGSFTVKGYEERSMDGQDIVEPLLCLHFPPDEMFPDFFYTTHLPNAAQRYFQLHSDWTNIEFAVVEG
ncbi:hypothetical protein K474DRAFT_715727 [Panus rudis PR-1116 ss-1]|nr:hypothetical protein K474DRAFT_715727 [Panus rudis PR-1116 ss-1]